MPVKEVPTSGPSNGLEPVLVYTRRRADLLKALLNLGEFAIPLSISKSSQDLLDQTVSFIRSRDQPAMKMTVWARLLVALE